MYAGGMVEIRRFNPRIPPERVISSRRFLEKGRGLDRLTNASGDVLGVMFISVRRGCIFGGGGRDTWLGRNRWDNLLQLLFSQSPSQLQFFSVFLLSSGGDVVNSLFDAAFAFFKAILAMGAGPF